MTHLFTILPINPSNFPKIPSWRVRTGLLSKISKNGKTTTQTLTQPETISIRIKSTGLRKYEKLVHCVHMNRSERYIINIILLPGGLMGRIVKGCVREVSLAQVSCILMYVYVAPPTPVGAWSMALGLRQRFEYYYYCPASS